MKVSELHNPKFAFQRLVLNDRGGQYGINGR